MKWLLRSALTLVTIVLLGVLVLVLIPTERIARLATDRIEAATGRAVTISGPVRATLWPRLGVRAEGVVVANADWSQDGPMLSAQALEVGIAPASLFGGTIRIETLEVTGARLLLERRADGVGNWEVAGLGPAIPAATDSAPTVAASASPSREVTIDRVVLSDAEVTWIDRAADRQITLRAVDLSTRIDGLDAPVRITGSALVGDRAVRLDASADALRPLLDGALVPVAVTLESGATMLGLNGRADLEPLSFEGRVELRSTDRFALLSAAGLATPDLPVGLGARSVDLLADLTLAPAGTLHLRGIDAKLDGNAVTGAIDIDPTGVRPRVTANLAAARLDLTGGADGATGAAGGSSGARDAGWSRAPIDVSALFAADADLTLTTGPAQFPGAAIEEANLRVTVDDGRAVVSLQPLRAYGGVATGEVVVNGRGGLSTRADVIVSGLQMQPFLSEVAGFDRLSGTADLSLGLLAVGDTQQALMDGLEGTASLRLGAGAIEGLDLVGMVRTLDLGYRGAGQQTVFDGLSISAAVTGGVARSDDLALTGTYLSAGGEGAADLGARTISYRVLPTLRAEADGKGLTVPVLIEGPWDDPRIRPDLEYLARERLDIERDKLEARARAEAGEARIRVEGQARQKLADELNVAPDALTSRDAVEGAIAERVQDKLLDLLQGR